MTSHAPVQLLGRTPLQQQQQQQSPTSTARRTPNHHHLPPLLMQPRLSLTTDTTPVFARRGISSTNALNSPVVPPHGSSLFRNCCSVSTVGPGADVDQRRGNGRAWKDAVSYAVQHQLPAVLNEMLQDLLRERPESEVDAWMLRWFERAYDRRQRWSQWRSSQQGLNQSQRREMRRPSGGGAGKAIAARPPLARYHPVAPLPSVATSRIMPSGSEDQTLIAPCSTSAGTTRYTIVVQSPVPTGGGHLQITPEEANFEILSAPTTPLVRTNVAQRSLQPPLPLPLPLPHPHPHPHPQSRSEMRRQSACEKEQHQPIVVRMPRAMEYRMKSLPPCTPEIGGGANSTSSNNNGALPLNTM